MDTLSIILTTLSGLLGCSTVVGWVFYRSANRRVKDAEAMKAEAEARLTVIETQDKEAEHNDKRFDALHEDIAVLNTQLTEAYRQMGEKEKVITDKTNRIREKDTEIFGLNDRVLKLTMKIGRMEMLIQWLRIWHCSREYPREEMTEEELCETCRRRRPPHPFPIKYDPPAECRDLRDRLSIGKPIEFNITETNNIENG